ncbi:MAG: DUF4339 domain-containing protein [Solobacterium sp.]|jgi:hypothetical protein|nr:DUF4339 domain-containing protein [Solobacterium sp.]MCH4222166.1 DUF4339 domain-containing protein [Solobacterium sp.]MCH4265620.1 DUF4339 domain-containing protein [Solobacterium sp.]
MDKVWYYTEDGETKYGPYSDAELIKLIQEGIITKEHFIWMVDMSGWVKVDDSIYSVYLPVAAA